MGQSALHGFPKPISWDIWHAPQDYLIVPIHDELHWSLALVCFPGGVGDPNRQQAILHLDSLRGMHRLTHIKPRLLCYLEEEWKEKQKEKLQVGYRVLRFRVLRL